MSTNTLTAEQIEASPEQIVCRTREPDGERGWLLTDGSLYVTCLQPWCPVYEWHAHSVPRADD